MRKLFTIIIALLAISYTTQAQVAWDAVKVSTTKIPAADTAYFSITSRGGIYQSFNSGRADSINASALPTGFAPGDSLVWRVEKGAPYGTIQRIRLVNSRTGQYLYIGKKGGLTKVVYAGPRVDPYNGQKDLYLVDAGTKSTTQYYAIADNDGDRIGNWTTGLLTVYSSTGAKLANAANQWIFASKKGPQPKPAAAKSPAISLSTNEKSFYANGSVKLNAALTKENYNFNGLTLLYRGTTLVDTVDIDANGVGSYTFSGLAQGTETFTLVYTGDQNYAPADNIISLTVGAALTAKATKIQLTLPTSAELHTDVALNVKATTTDNTLVSGGAVVVYVNGIAKNRISIDSEGNGSLVFPNLLVGTEKIKAYYVGNGIDFLSSDTVSTSVEITPSLSNIKPYPVYFDLCAQPVIRQWNYKYPIESTNVTTLGHSFPQDSIPGITLELPTATVAYVPLALSYTTTDYKDYYNHSDNIVLALGNGRSKWVNFSTPWLNEGSYNIYLSQRLPNSSTIIPITNITLDDKEIYWPNEELTGRWLNYGGSPNNTRRWNAKGHSSNLPLFYLGSVKIDKSDVHNLKISVATDNGSDAVTLDMLQIIPVDQDSLSINASASVNFAKVYYPLFDLGGYARQANDVPATSYNYFRELSQAYQVTDQTVYSTKSHTITDLKISDSEAPGVDYVNIYLKDKWTRIAEGIVKANATFTAQLPIGTYYYEEINYVENSLISNSNGDRYFIKSGTFTVTDETALKSTLASSIIAYVNANQLTVKAIKAGARIQVTDFTGKTVLQAVSTSDVFSAQINPGVYIVKVISANDYPLVTKVIVK